MRYRQNRFDARCANLTIKCNDTLPDKPQDIKLYTQDDLDKFAQGKSDCYITMYADWCSHCLQMKSALGGSFPHTPSVWFIESANLHDSLKIYYPRVLHYQNGVSSQSNTDDVLAFLKSQTK